MFWRNSSESLAHWSGYSKPPFEQVIDIFIIFKNLPRSGESLLNLFWTWRFYKLGHQFRLMTHSGHFLILFSLRRRFLEPAAPFVFSINIILAPEFLWLSELIFFVEEEEQRRRLRFPIGLESDHESSPSGKPDHRRICKNELGATNYPTEDVSDDNASDLISLKPYKIQKSY